MRSTFGTFRLIICLGVLKGNGSEGNKRKGKRREGKFLTLFVSFSKRNGGEDVIVFASLRGKGRELVHSVDKSCYESSLPLHYPLI